MPFDALDGSQSVTLTEYLRNEGITPVPMDRLFAHKKKMLRQHRASRWLTPLPYMLIGAATAVSLAILFPFFFLIPAIVVAGMSISALSFVIVALLSDAGMIRLAGKPYWTEYVSLDWTVPPAEIAKVVRHVQATLPPNGALIYGELKQDQVLLDPYIVLSIHGVPACLGIWDESMVIACATLETM